MEKKPHVNEKLDSIVDKIYNDFQKKRIPSLKVSSRTKSNITLDERHGVWKYGKQKSTRSAHTLDGASMLLKTVYMIDFIKDMIHQHKTSTLREMYYISEGWGDAKFSAQQDSDHLSEDLEIISALMREDFHLRPEEDGARVIGNITIEETTRRGERKKIHCQDDVGDSGYSIPYYVEPDKLTLKESDVKLAIAIETGGMFDRLAENGFDEKFQALLIHLKGQPARSTRRFIKRLNQEKNIPLVVFTDGDPWSYRIFASIAYGAIKTAHISEYLATPSAQFLGVSPSDIINYKLPSDTLTEQDKKALEAELTDPRFSDEFWKGEIKLQLELGKKSEQQSLAKYGLDYVTDVFLPEKLAEMAI